MLPLLLVSAALAASEPVDGDIIVKLHIDSTAPTLYDYLLDLHHHRDLWPETCVKKWTFGQTTQGLGATAQVVYHPSIMHRKLVATVSKATEDRRVDVDHAGNKGFVTTWTLTPDDRGVDVEIHTWVNAPPKPFQGFYFSRVQPSWKACHEEALKNLRRAARDLVVVTPDLPDEPAAPAPPPVDIPDLGE